MRSCPELPRLKFSGGVDADGHILEDKNLWENYLEAKYKPRALRIKKDPQSGLEYMEIEGRPSRFLRHGMFAGLSAMGDTGGDQARFGGGRNYGDSVPFGAMDPNERLERIDAEGLRAAFLYPTLSLLYEAETADPEMAQAYTRAYNRYIVDYCKDSGGRLLPVAHISLGDPEAAAAELERAVRDGCKGAWVCQFVMTRKPHAHPDHDPVFAKAQELGIPFGIHPSLEPVWAMSGRYDWKYLHGQFFFNNIVAGDSIRHAFTSFFQYGTFEKFPRLKLVLLEAGASWISYWLDRLDAVFKSGIGRTLILKELPSFYFKRQVWISADPDERALPAMADLVGADKFFWASDFPHPDHTGGYIEEVEEMAERLKPEARSAVLGENVMRVYNCL